jgi:hypothetical protein
MDAVVESERLQVVPTPCVDDPITYPRWSTFSTRNWSGE